MKTLALLFSCAALCGCASPADAGSLVDVAVVDNTTGERLQTWRHGGRTWIAGQPGHRYSLQLDNRSGGRVLTVISVDGVNVVSGQTAAAQQSGYVLGAWSAAEIRGWRKSLDESARFYFTSLADSYAARTGRPDNVGVIGIAVYRERVVEPQAEAAPAAPLAKSAAEPAPAMGSAGGALRDSAAAQRAEERIGTGHGERVADPTRYTEFQRASSHPAEVIEIRYDSYANLVARGVVREPRPRWPGEPRPFPGGFVPDPAG